jgi:hypothetical protein
VDARDERGHDDSTTSHHVLEYDVLELTWKLVMAGRVPAIHVFDFAPKAWMPATSAGMTIQPQK